MDTTSEAALKLEIARLSGAINRHKSALTGSSTATSWRSRNNVYVNPNYKPPSNASSSTQDTRTQPKTKDVIIGGLTFESSGRSLVRKGLPKPPSTSKSPSTKIPPSRDFTRVNGRLVTAGRIYKPKSAPRGRRPSGRHMTLDNSRRPYAARNLTTKRNKYSDKPCPRFTATGSCSRGLTCAYQHDPSRIAICWNFLQGNCPNTAETCNLSHEPTPERTPLCMHFANNGRCTRENCPFPHVRVAARDGICRDFAVLGYCAKGLECDKQHVRECPDFAEKGACLTRGCKLPHVIRANRQRKSNVSPTVPPANLASNAGSASALLLANTDDSGFTDTDSGPQALTAQDATLGDEYISLTFNESYSSEDDTNEDEDEEDEEDHDDNDPSDK